MPEISEFFKFSNPLFLDAFVAVVLYSLCKLLAWRRFPRISEGIREASLVFIVFMFYDASRYFALDSEEKAKENALKVIRFEQAIHIDVEKPMERFAMVHEEFGKFLNHFYLGAHWGGLVIFFVWAYARVIFASQNKMERRRKEYVQFRGRFIIMNIIAACSFMLYPCAPPRLFPELGYGDTLKDLGKTDVYTGTRRWVNPYAAMPSMHQGYSLLFATTIIIMLRSEILAQASGVEPDEEDDDIESGQQAKLQPTPSGLLATLAQLRTRYQQYRVLSYATRSNSTKLFYISLLPLVFLIYPAFMFVVIVATGNHFTLDALAGAGAMGLAVLLQPPVLRAVLFVRDAILRAGHACVAYVAEHVFGVRSKEVELTEVKEKESEEKEGFLADPSSEV
eukprot:Phypoly_transcript_09758.p1 GENE.Phypoly_transcript_09758~~Phypoly_transcript_09758.p1  ORF type:complete len:394 (+),score=76.23 Phypoly_transcript_09758:149-1330(+)